MSENEKAIEAAEFLFGFVGGRLARLLIGHEPGRAAASKPQEDCDCGVPTEVVLTQWCGNVSWPTLRRMVDDGYFPEPINPECHRGKVWDQHDLMDWDDWRRADPDHESYKVWRRAGAERFDERGLDVHC